MQILHSIGFIYCKCIYISGNCLFISGKCDFISGNCQFIYIHTNNPCQAHLGTAFSVRIRFHSDNFGEYRPLSCTILNVVPLLQTKARN